jgi:hypothetical protein
MCFKDPAVGSERSKSYEYGLDFSVLLFDFASGPAEVVKGVEEKADCG